MNALVSGEGVTLDLERAGVGSRTVAKAIDLSIQAVLLFVVGIVDGLILGGDAATDAAVVIVEIVLIYIAYPVLFEWLTQGRTLGKMMLGLRVVRDDGGPIGFRHALIRGLFGIPPALWIGLIVLAFSPDSKRVGDYVAGTFVVRERVPDRGVPITPWLVVPPYLQPWAMALDLTRVDDSLALSVRQLLNRAWDMTPAARTQLEWQLGSQLLAVTSPPPPYGTPMWAVLTTVLAERGRRAQQRGW
jgi:uncharacterized RDD family membrane protein YckC